MAAGAAAKKSMSGSAGPLSCCGTLIPASESGFLRGTRLGHVLFLSTDQCVRGLHAGLLTASPKGNAVNDFWAYRAFRPEGPVLSAKAEGLGSGREPGFRRLTAGTWPGSRKEPRPSAFADRTGPSGRNARLLTRLSLLPQDAPHSRYRPREKPASAQSPRSVRPSATAC